MSKDKMSQNNPSMRNEAQNNRGGQEKTPSTQSNPSDKKSSSHKSEKTNGGKHTADR